MKNPQNLQKKTLFLKDYKVINKRQMVGRTDFGRTPLDTALKGQYNYLMVINLRSVIVEHNIGQAIILLNSN